MKQKIFLICNLFVLTVACSSDGSVDSDSSAVGRGGQIETEVFVSPRGAASGDQIFVNLGDLLGVRDRAIKSKRKLKSKKRKLQKERETRKEAEEAVFELGLEVAELKEQVNFSQAKRDRLERLHEQAVQENQQLSFEADRWKQVAFSVADEAFERRDDGRNWQEIAQRLFEELKRKEELVDMLMGQLESTARELRGERQRQRNRSFEDDFWEDGSSDQSQIAERDCRFPFDGGDVDFRDEDH